jgi:glycosyltransferase involved in cell wall biosynthesis
MMPEKTPNAEDSRAPRRENQAANGPAISVVVPCYNEEAGIRAFFEAARAALDPLQVSYEIIVTDDLSADSSWAVLKECAARDPRLRAQRLATHCGQSAALWAGIQAARGRHIITLDSDLQNDPRDLPAFLKALERFDCVCGSRVAARRQGDSWVRIVSSRVANWVRNKLSGERIEDAGCTYRAFKRECVADLKFFKGMHRFLPTLVKMEGFTVAEIPISHHPRRSGRTNYGVWNRLFASFYDLLAVRWMKRRMFRFQVAERINEPDTP